MSTARKITITPALRKQIASLNSLIQLDENNSHLEEIQKKSKN